MIGLLFLSLLMYQCLGRYVLNYRFEADGFSVVAIGFIPIVFVAYHDIVDVRRLRGLDLWMTPGFWTIRCGNRILGEAVSIHVMRPIANMIIVTPDDIDRFLLQMAWRVPKAD
jgi:hypothetical protein